MFDSSRLLNSILDHMIALLPTEPASFKRLDDIGEAEPSGSTVYPDPVITESGYPESGVQVASTVRAAS